MPFFRITKAKGGQPLGHVEGEDEDHALDVFAMKSGFWDFQDLAQSMDMTVTQAHLGLSLRETSEPPQPVPEYVVP